MIAWRLYPNGDVDEIDVDPVDLGLLLLPDDDIVRFIGLCRRLTDDSRCPKNDPSSIVDDSRCTKNNPSLIDDDVTR